MTLLWWSTQSRFAEYRCVSNIGSMVTGTDVAPLAISTSVITGF